MRTKKKSMTNGEVCVGYFSVCGTERLMLKPPDSEVHMVSQFFHHSTESTSLLQ